MSGERIRSGHQRRVLNWLLDGGGTVSEIAESLQLRMPHASLALRQLRERQEVSREEQGSMINTVSISGVKFIFSTSDSCLECVFLIVIIGLIDLEFYLWIFLLLMHPLPSFP